MFKDSPFLKRLVVLALCFTQPFSLYAGIESAPVFFASEAMSQIRSHTVRLCKMEQGKCVNFCSGVITNDLEVTSAGHCLAGKDLNHVYVEIYDSKEKILRRFKTKDEKFFDDGNRDGAVLSFEADAQSIQGLRQASLPITDKCDPNSTYFVAGYGSNENKDDHLRVSEYKLPIAKELKAEPKFFGHEIYLKSKKGIMCSGDSGGPIFCQSKGKLQLVGVSILRASQNLSHVYWEGSKDTKPSGLEKVENMAPHQDCKSYRFLGGTKIDSIHGFFKPIARPPLNLRLKTSR